MASSLDLTVQGDVATIADQAKLPEIKLMGPLELYRLWERQGWASHRISLDTALSRRLKVIGIGLPAVAG